MNRRTGQTEEQLNTPETQTNEQPSERTHSRMTKLTIKRSTECSPARTNERRTDASERTRETRWTVERPSGQLFYFHS